MSNLKVGEVFESRYLVKLLLGSGGMGAVYAVEDLRDNHRPLAIKTLLPHRVNREIYRSRINAEISIMQRLDHKNIVKIHDFQLGSIEEEEQRRDPYIVMELLKGQSLGELAKLGNYLTLGGLLDLILEVLSALEVTHQNGIIHRDLKPDNLFICSDSQSDKRHLKILDFGVSKDLESDVSLTASLGSPLIGTLHYMAPEQIRNERLTPQTDLYALGVIIYESIIGHPPFAISPVDLPTELTTLPSGLKLTWLHLNFPPPVLEFNESLNELFQSLLAKDPSERPNSASELAQRLREWSESHSDTLFEQLPLKSSFDPDIQREIHTSSLLTLESLNKGQSERPQSIDPHLLRLNPTISLETKIKSKDSESNDQRVIRSEEMTLINGERVERDQEVDIEKSEETAESSRLSSRAQLLISMTIISFMIGLIIFSMIMSSITPIDTLEVDQHLGNVNIKVKSTDQIMAKLLKVPLLFDVDQGYDRDSYLRAQSALSGVKGLTSLKRSLYMAYLRSGLTDKFEAKRALLYLSKVRQSQLSSSLEWHLYGESMRRLNLEASSQSRLKVALKVFGYADQALLSLGEPLSLIDYIAVEHRVEIYLSHNKEERVVKLLDHLGAKHPLNKRLADALQLAMRRLLERSSD